MIRTATLGAAVALFAGSAQATLFSFASDSDHRSPAFEGIGSQVNDQGLISGPLDQHQLLVDDDNGILPPLGFLGQFDAQLTLSSAMQTPLGAGTYLYSYALNGTFRFISDDGSPLLEASIQGGIMTALGTATSWGTTATMQANDLAGAVTYTWLGPTVVEYGLFQGQSFGLDDAAFTLTDLTSLTGGFGVALDAGFLPASFWQAEGSFSGTGNFVPAPGAAVLLALAGARARRRRR